MTAEAVIDATECIVPCFESVDSRIQTWQIGIVEGYGAAVQGSPAAAVAWLANTLGACGVTLDAGEIILSGSLVPLAPAVAGDVFEMDLHGSGRCVARFV